MPLSFLLAAFAPVNPQTYFDRCVDGLKRMGSYSVHIDSVGIKGSRREVEQYDFSISGSSALLRVREQGTQLMASSDRSFQITGSQLVAYDSNTNEVIHRKFQDHDSILQRFQALLGKMDPALVASMDPAMMRVFLAQYRATRDWKATRSNGVVSLGRSSKGTAEVIRFDLNSGGQLTEVWLANKGSSADWKFRFKPGSNVTLSVPSNAKRVTSFYVREAPPIYKSPEAKSAVLAMLKTYGNLTRGKIDIDSDGVPTTLYLNGRRLRQDTKLFSWAFDDGILTAHNRLNGKIYQGKAIRVILAEYLSKIGGDVDPLIMRLLSHRTPYQELFPALSSVELAGSAGSGDSKADIVVVKTPTVHLSMFIRRSTHLLDSLESETSDTSGRTLTRTFRRFSYSEMDEGPGKQAFHLDIGTAKPMPLPSVDTGTGR